MEQYQLRRALRNRLTVAMSRGNGRILLIFCALNSFFCCYLFHWPLSGVCYFDIGTTLASSNCTCRCASFGELSFLFTRNTDSNRYNSWHATNTGVLRLLEVVFSSWKLTQVSNAACDYPGFHPLPSKVWVLSPLPCHGKSFPGPAALSNANIHFNQNLRKGITRSCQLPVGHGCFSILMTWGLLLKAKPVVSECVQLPGPRQSWAWPVAMPAVGFAWQARLLTHSEGRWRWHNRTAAPVVTAMGALQQFQI